MFNAQTNKVGCLLLSLQKQSLLTESKPYASVAKYLHSFYSVTYIVAQSIKIIVENLWNFHCNNK